MKFFTLSLALAALCASCGVEVSSTPAPPVAPAGPAAQTVAVPSGVHEVRCGCKIDSVGHCGNYVDVDGDWLVIGNPADHGLGAMEWCSATEPVKAMVAGNRTDDTLNVTELVVQ